MNRNIEILKKNENGKEGTFIYFLHEQDVFDEESFWKYYDAILHLSTEKFENKKEIDKIIIDTYSYILKSIIFHLLENDGYEILNFPKHTITDYLDRIENVVKAYFGEYKLNESKFDDDLR